MHTYTDRAVPLAVCNVSVCWFTVVFALLVLQAEFSGGILMCNGVVAVRRVSATPPLLLQ